MKNLFKLSTLILLCLMTYSCSSEDDLVTSESKGQTSSKSFVANQDDSNNPQSISFTQTVFLGESNAASQLNSGDELKLFLNGIPAFRLVMQKDSNLVLYTDNNRVLWATNTPRPLGNNPIFILQNDRNAVVYSYPININALWWYRNVAEPFVNNPYFKLRYEKKINTFNGTSYYIRCIAYGNGEELYDIFNIKL